MLVLSEVFDEFLDLKEINPKPSEQSVRRLIEVAGDLPVDHDLSPKFPPSLHGVLGVKSVTLGGHFVHVLSLHEFHRRQVA